MRNRIGKIVKKSCFLALPLLLLSQLPSLAQNVLSEIQINPEGNSYQVVLKTDAPVPIKKVIEANNKIYIELQNVEPLASVSTVYNNVPNINNVIVEPSSKNSVKILLQGKNADKAKVQFETIGGMKDSSYNKRTGDSIELNPPIEAYNNIYENEVEEHTPAISTSLKTSLIAGLKYAKGMIGSKMMYFLGFVLIFAFGARLFTKGKEATSTKTLTGTATQEPARPQREVLPQLPPRRKSSLVDTTVGLRSYQDSQKSPYATPYRTPLRRNRTPLTTIPSSPTELKTTPLADLKSKVMTATLNSHATEATQPLKQLKGGVDSKKFIETMTKIYEKNGRTDLAEGLRNSLRKAQARKI